MSTKREKTGGRAAGTPNKRTVQALEVFGDFCPLEGIIKRLQKPGIRDEVYINACLKLAEFKFPKRKAIEHMLDLSSVETEDLVKEAAEIIAQYTGETNGL